MKPKTTCFWGWCKRLRGPPGDVQGDFKLGLDLLKSDKVGVSECWQAGAGGGGGEC